MNTTRGHVAALAADFEQVLRRVPVHAHAEVEIRFRLAADDCRQMEYRRGLGGDGAFEEPAVGDVARELFEAGIAQPGSGDDVDERDLADGRVLTVRAAQRTALQ